MNDTLRRLLEERRGSIPSVLDEGDSLAVSDEAWEAARRRNFLSVVERYDPLVAFSEELTVRLVGPNVKDALFPIAQDPILDGVRRVFTATANVELGIVGVSHGSTVLHLRPVDADPVEQILDGPPVRESHADMAGEALVAAVDALERDDSPARWPDTVEGLAKVSGELDKHDMDATFTWSGRDGSVRAATFTSVGRRKLAALSSGRSEERTAIVAGRLIEVREASDDPDSFVVKLKDGTAKTSATSLVSIPAELGSTFLANFGERMHVRVTKRITIDGLGREVVDKTMGFVDMATEGEFRDFM